MIGISGMGVYIPPNKVSVDVLGAHLCSRQINKTGIKSVSLETDLTATQMAIEASIKALDDSGVAPLDIDLIINTQSSLHDYLLWQVSAAVQDGLQAHNSKFFDIYQGCSGFIMGLIISKKFLQSDGTMDTILVNTSEKWHATLQDGIVGGLVFGEGGTAAVIQKNSTGNFILGDSMICRGGLNDVSRMPVGSVNPPNRAGDGTDYYYNVTNPDKARKEMIPVNVETFYRVGEEAVLNSGLTMDDVDHIIFPNVGFGLFEKVIKKFNFSPEKTNYRYVAETGDCGTVDTLLSYYRMLNDGLLQKGEHVLILAQGAGATWAAVVIEV